MATAIDKEKAADEYKDAKCSICAKENKDEIADYYCFDCNKHMCTSCLGTHNKFIDNHNVVQGLGNGRDVLTEKCGKHADELITLYCCQHDEVLCRICCLFDHWKCQDLQNISDSSDELNADPELQAVPALLNSALDNINRAIEALDEHLACIKKNGYGFLKDLEVYAKKLLSRIEELKEKGKNDIKSKQKELLAVAKGHRQACTLTKDEINQCLDKITEEKGKANMFVLKKKGQTIAQKVDDLYNSSDGLIKGHQFNFMNEMKILDSINCFYSLVNEASTTVHDFSSQGAMGDELDRLVQAITKSPGDRQVRRPVEKQGDRPVVKPEKKPPVENPTVSKQVRNINVKISGDEDILLIYGCCHLSDGSLVIADHSNKSLKHVDPLSSKVTKYCDTDGQPTDVCCIGPQELAVAFSGGSTQVDVYNTVSRTRTRTLELGHDTDSIACHGGQLYCARWFFNILYIHDVRRGRKLREISRDTDGRELFFHIVGIAVNSSGDRVYLTDMERGLVCVGADGKRIFRLSHQDLGLSRDAWGVTTDHHGHVFVSGSYSHNVVKVTEDGHVVGQILSEEDGIKWDPLCLSYDVSRSSLYVGGKSDQVLMVEWK